MVVVAAVFSCLLLRSVFLVVVFFFFNDTATTEIYTLSLHDALPISVIALLCACGGERNPSRAPNFSQAVAESIAMRYVERSEEHTSELQSLAYLVCRLLLEKKKKRRHKPHQPPMALSLVLAPAPLGP